MMKHFSDHAEGQICTVCGADKPIGEFYEYARKASDGARKLCRYRHCKSCHLQKTNKWRKENPEAIAEIEARGRAVRRDSIAKYMKEYRSLNRRSGQTEDQKLRRRMQVKADPLRFVSYRLKWLSKPGNRQKYNAWQANRRARVSGASGSFSLGQWLALCEKFGGKCLRCREVLPLTVDHVVPISTGGTNDIGNIQPLCGPCNSAKGAQTIDYRGNSYA